MVGGMERFAYHLATALACSTSVEVISNHRGRKLLPCFLLYATAAALRLVKGGRIDVIHLCDALLAPVGVVLKRLVGLPVSASVHGLDITYGNRIYQALIPQALSKLDVVITGSQSTRALLLDRVPALGDRARLIPYGVEASHADCSFELAPALAALVEGKRILLTVGRLVKRKGVAWFVKNVLPSLPDDAVYVVVGDGPERRHIEAAARAAGVAESLVMVSGASDPLVQSLYERAAVFVMPNVPVSGDVEGFGLVALEAASHGLPVVASRLQGIQDAVKDGKNGVLVQPEDAEAFRISIERLLKLEGSERKSLGSRYRQFTLDHYSWAGMAGQYLEEFRGLTCGSDGGLDRVARLQSLSGFLPQPPDTRDMADAA